MVETRETICWLLRGKLIPADTFTVQMVQAMPLILATCRKVRADFYAHGANDNRALTPVEAKPHLSLAVPKVYGRGGES